MKCGATQTLLTIFGMKCGATQTLLTIFGVKCGVTQTLLVSKTCDPVLRKKRNLLKNIGFLTDKNDNGFES